MLYWIALCLLAGGGIMWYITRHGYLASSKRRIVAYCLIAVAISIIMIGLIGWGAFILVALAMVAGFSSAFLWITRRSQMRQFKEAIKQTGLRYTPTALRSFKSPKERADAKKMNKQYFQARSKLFPRHSTIKAVGSVFLFIVAIALVAALVELTSSDDTPSSNEATVEVTETPNTEENLYEEATEQVTCSSDSPYYQFGVENMAADLPASEKLAADADLLAWAAENAVERYSEVDIDTSELLTGDGDDKCLNQDGIELYKELIIEVDIIAELERLVEEYQALN